MSRATIQTLCTEVIRCMAHMQERGEFPIDTCPADLKAYAMELLGDREGRITGLQADRDAWLAANPGSFIEPNDPRSAGRWAMAFPDEADELAELLEQQSGPKTIVLHVVVSSFKGDPPHIYTLQYGTAGEPILAFFDEVCAVHPGADVDYFNLEVDAAQSSEDIQTFINLLAESGEYAPIKHREGSAS